MLRFNLSEAKPFFVVPNHLVFSSALMASNDEDVYSTTHSPYIYSATIQDDADHITFVKISNDTALVSGMKNSFALALPALSERGTQLFHLNAQVSAHFATGFVSVYCFIGVLTATSISAGAKNALASYFLVPSKAVAISDRVISLSVDTDFMVIPPVTENPIVFGVTFENYAGANQNGNFRASLGFQKNYSNISVYDPAFT